MPISVGRSHSLLADGEINSISQITAKINSGLVGCTAVYVAHIPNMQASIGVPAAPVAAKSQSVGIG